MGEVCPLIKEWRVRKLWSCKYVCYLDDNDSPTILREIKEIQFPNLEYISLSGNNIESVEGLSQIHLPRLKWLFIGTDANI